MSNQQLTSETARIFESFDVRETCKILESRFRIIFETRVIYSGRLDASEGHRAAKRVEGAGMESRRTSASEACIAECSQVHRAESIPRRIDFASVCTIDNGIRTVARDFPCSFAPRERIAIPVALASTLSVSGIIQVGQGAFQPDHGIKLSAFLLFPFGSSQGFAYPTIDRDTGDYFAFGFAQ